MKLSKFSNRFFLSILCTCFAGFAILSWILLFRDGWILEGIEVTYPFLKGILFAWQDDLFKFGLNIIPTFIFAILAIIAFGAYFLLLKKDLAVKTVIKWAVIFQVIVFFSYPILSSDVFSYISIDRVFTAHGQNKWLVPPIEVDNYQADTFWRFADWDDQTSVYGILQHVIYLPAVYLGMNDVFSTALFYKLTAGIFGFVSIFVFLRLLADRTEKEKSYYLRLIFFNPLFLLEIFGSGHNDIIMIFFVLLSLIFWRKKQWIWAGMLVAAAVQVKLIPVIFFGFFALNLLQKKKFSGFIQYSTAFILINALSFWLMQVGPLNFMQRVIYNTQSFWQSLPGLDSRFLPGLKIPFAPMFAILGIILIWLQIKKNWHPLFTSVLALITYLFFFTAAYWNWYVLWVFLLVPFIKNQALVNLILVLTFTSLMAYPILWFSYRFGFGNPVWQFIIYFWIFAVPIGYLGYNKGNYE